MNKRNLNYTVDRPVYGEEKRHTELIVLFMLEGWMILKLMDEDYRMQAGDIILINPGIVYEIKRGEGALYGIASYSMNVTTSVLQNRKMMFFCNSVVDVSHSYQDMREIFYELTKEYTAETHQTHAYIDSLMLKLFDCIIENYQVVPSDPDREETMSDFRMREIMQYIIANLDREISLNEIANRMFVSASTLSRVFKKKTGVYFADYVMQMRIQASLPLLAHTEQSITKIALTSGFTTSASYNRSFKKIMGIVPTEYRKKNQNKGKEEEELLIKKENDIRLELKEKGYERGLQKYSEGRETDVSLKGKKFEKNWNKAINVGNMNDLTRANVQNHVIYLSEQLGYKVFRIWSVFSKKMMLSDGKSTTVYNYNIVDQVLDFLVQHKLKPFLEFGRRPEMAVSSGRKTVYYNEEYINFDSKEAWENLVEDFIDHIIARYGIGEVSDWIFELTRDIGHEHTHPDYGLYRDEKYDFFNAFAFFLKTVKKKIHGAEFGGIGYIFGMDEESYQEFFRRCHEDKLEPDFLSFFLFPYSESCENGSVRKSRVSENEDYDEDCVEAIQHIMKDSGMEGSKIYITEWNNSISNRNYLNDSCLRAAYFARKLVNISSKVDLIAVMSASDWISNYVDTVGVVNGGIGLLTKDSIKKPAYYALEFLDQMGEYLLDKGDDHIVSRDEDGDIYILCYHYSWFRKNYFDRNEDEDCRKNIDAILRNNIPIDIRIRLKNFESPGIYCIKYRILNEDNGSVMNEWAKLQFSTKLSRQDLKYLEAKSVPDIRQESYEIKDSKDTMELELRLKPMELQFIHICKSNMTAAHIQ